MRRNVIKDGDGSDMSLTAATPEYVANKHNTFEVEGSVTTAGNYATHGVTLDLSATCPTNSAPYEVKIYEQPPTGTSASGNQYVYAKGTTPANGAVQVFAPGGTEVTNGTSFAAAGVANLRYKATFPKFL